MKVLNDFECHSCGLIAEHLVENSVITLECLECGKRATKVISPIRCKLEGITGDFPGAHMRWAKVREQKMKEEMKHDQ
jgi:hypothetical protein